MEELFKYVNLNKLFKKADLKNVPHIETSCFALKTDLARLNTEIDKLEIDKSVPVLFGLSKLTDVVKNYLVKKFVYVKLVAKVITLTLVNLLWKLNIKQTKQN